MNQPKISIIVPVYNPGEYFEQCLISLVSQTLTDIEIIIILDCPTDRSDEIAKKYAERDQRIKLIYNEKNIHAGLSRNKGMEIACGEYIGFHDADDYSEPRMYELLYNKGKQNDLDAVRCNFKCIYPPNSGIKDEFYKYPAVTEDTSQKNEIYKRVCNNTVSCVVWSHIFKTEFIRKYNLQFVDSSIVTSEDSIFFIEAYRHLDKLGIVPDCLYYHIFHQTNTGKTYKHRSVRNRISFFENLYYFLRENNIEEKKALSYISENIAKSSYSASRQALLEFPLKQALGEISQIKENDLMMKAISSLYQKENKPILSGLKLTIRVYLFLLRKF